jgi:hypothetical protein
MLPASFDAPPSSGAPPDPVEPDPPFPPAPVDDVVDALVDEPVAASLLEEPAVPPPLAPPVPSVVAPVVPGPVAFPLVGDPVAPVVFALPESEPQAASIALETSAIQRSEGFMGQPFLLRQANGIPRAGRPHGRSPKRSAASHAIRCSKIAHCPHFMRGARET